MTTAQGVYGRLLLLAVWPPVAVMLLMSVGAWLLVAAPFAASAWTSGALVFVGCAGVLAVSVRQATGTAGRIAENAAAVDMTVSWWLTRLQAAVTDGRENLEVPTKGNGRTERPAPHNPVHPSARSVDGKFRAVESALLQYQHEAGKAASEESARQQVLVLVSIARRLQTLVARVLAQLDLMEREVEDPELMDRIFQADHLVTRVRRAAESLAVLGGAVPRRLNRAVPVQSILRSAISEVESYRRVRVLQAPHGQVLGHVAADVVHLLAELIENATQFSPSDTAVHIRAEEVPAGLVIEIDDRGLLMSAEQRTRTNQLLASPELYDATTQLSSGRIGLYVVAQLARRHHIRVRIQTNVYGGNQAVVLLTHALLAAPVGQPTPAAVPGANLWPSRPGQGRPGTSGQPGQEAGTAPAPRSPARAPSPASDTLLEPCDEQAQRTPLPRRGGSSSLAPERRHITGSHAGKSGTAAPQRAARFLQTPAETSEASDHPDTAD
jgi:signal transduction histidine kinase